MSSAVNNLPGNLASSNSGRHFIWLLSKVGVVKNGERNNLSEMFQGLCSSIGSAACMTIQRASCTSPSPLLLPPQLMKYKHYSNMVSFLHHSCGNGVLEIGAAPSGKETTSSKDGFLWTLALHLHRLQRYAAGSNPACKITVM